MLFRIAISICIAVTYYYFFSGNEVNRNIFSSADPFSVAIGVLSARENFKLREAARSTWLKNYLPNKKNIGRAWFIVGKDDCKIHPDYRLNKYGCDEWNITILGLNERFYTCNEIVPQSCPLNAKQVFRQGFSFKVNHPVIVKRLGVLFNLLVPNVETRVAILDVQSKEIVVETKITRNTSSIKSGYLYEDVETVLLPKHYEGMVLVEGFLLSEACSNVLWNNGSGVITFNQIYLTPSHLESVKFTEDKFSAASIQFFVHEIESLNATVLQKDTATSEWIKKVENLNEKLIVESREKNDILFVDVVDTYRNLPIKLLHFYKWLDQNHKFNYAIKSDDDTVVDISHFIKKLKHNSWFDTDEKWIWGLFRRDWPVNYIGKWADYDYRSSSYPAFPCGASYIISHEIVRWLSSNAKDLFSYQGEDVSMGIWLSAIKPAMIDDDNFDCDSTCSIKSYNRAQLTVVQIYESWSFYEKCNNLCMCK